MMVHVRCCRKGYEMIGNEGDATYDRCNLSRILVILAGVYQATRSLDKCKITLDEAISLIEMVGNGPYDYDLSGRHAAALGKLAMHSHLNGDRFKTGIWRWQSVLREKEEISAK